MKKTLTLAAVAVGLILSSAGAMAEDAGKTDAKRDHGKRHEERFAKTDTNGDGFITKDEMTAAQKEKMDKMFAELDTNKDSKLSKDEMKAGKEKMRAKMKARWEEKKAKGDLPAEKPAVKPAE